MRVAFIKFAGMTIGGSELWLQKMAAHLPKENLQIDYFYCDDAPYIGGEHVPATSSPERIEFLEKNGVNVIKFSVRAKNIRSLTHDWVDTDFWEKFDESKYDLIQTVKAGPREYPFYKLKKPVVEIVALANRPDTSPNIAWSFHSSNWQRAQWVRLGGSIAKSSVLTSPVEAPQSTEDYRQELGIPQDDLVAGFLQRRDNLIASPMPLEAFAELQRKYPEESRHWHFIIKNGGDFYREQAKELGLKNVHFLGQTPDSSSVSKFFNTLDIFAHGRKDGETFGAIFVEAMMHGKPCMSHYAPLGANAQPETMGPAGLFAMDTEEYVRLLGRFFIDRTFREHLAAKAKPHAQKYYSIEKCVAEVMDVYEQITGKSLAPRHGERDSGADMPMPFGYSDMGFLYAGNMNKIDDIAYHVLVGGIPEAFDVAIVKSLLPHTKGFWDIGANTGIYCWIAAQQYAKQEARGAHVHIFEPQLSCIDALMATRSLNNWENISTVHPIGLSDSAGVRTLYLSGTGSSIAEDFVGHDLPKQQISVDTLDNIAANSSAPVDFIKIDVEGLEYSVLQGGAKTISHEKPIMFVEIADRIKSRDYANENFSKTIAWLAGMGYRLFECLNNSIKEIRPGYHNSDIAMYLCLHEEKHAHLVPVAQQAVEEYRRRNLLFGAVEKRLVRKAYNKIIPPYLTQKKLLAYAKRMLRIG